MAIAKYKPATLDLVVYRGDDLDVPLVFMQNAKARDDAVTNGTTALISTSGPFLVGDVGKAIVGDNIPFGTTIAAYVSATHITLSQAASGSKIEGDVQWGDAIDMSLWTFKAQVRRSADSPSALADFTFNTSQAAEGLLIASIAAGPMGGLPDATLQWDLERALQGKTRTLLAGDFVVGGDRTRT